MLHNAVFLHNTPLNAELLHQSLVEITASLASTLEMEGNYKLKIKVLSCTCDYSSNIFKEVLSSLTFTI